MSGATATLLAGVPLENPALFHRVRFAVGDPAAWIAISKGDQRLTHFICRDIEMARAKQQVGVDQVHCPADFTPEAGLSGDRMTATAQAVAESLRRQQVQVVTTDRTLPYVFAWHIQQLGIALEYSPELGVLQRRTKDAQELQWLAEAQAATESVMQMALETIAGATADATGQLNHDGAPLTSERLRQLIAADLLQREYTCPHGSIVASLPHSADCHAAGSGPLRTGQAVIVDIFPQNTKTHYHGDCTRTVVHGDAPDMIVRMHSAVVAALEAAQQQASAGAEAEAVHSATKSALAAQGFQFVRGQISNEPVMPHGTGHGIGLEVHEPILLDDNGGTLLENEVVTVEPGLYSQLHGGVRVEDMVVITDAAPKNLNRLPSGLCWS